MKQFEFFSEDNFSLYLADSLEFLDYIPPNSVDLIFADPPYHLSSGTVTCQSGQYSDVKKADWDMSMGVQEDFKFHYNWIKKCKFILKPEGTIWISGTMHSIYRCGFALELAGFHLLNDITWFKPNAAPNLSCKYFTHSHETLLWAIKDETKAHTFNYDLMKQGEWLDDYMKKPQSQMRSVWSINSTPQNERLWDHPTQKPLALLQKIILASSNVGDLVLDPFTGTSTTGIVAHSNNRKFIGIDNEKKYLEMSVDRFKKTFKQSNLFKDIEHASKT